MVLRISMCTIPGCTDITVLDNGQQCGGLIISNGVVYAAVDSPFSCTRCVEGTACIRDSAESFQCRAGEKSLCSSLDTNQAR